VNSGVWQLLVWLYVPYAPPGGGFPLPSTFIFKINTFIISIYETSFSGIREDNTYWRLGRQFKEPQSRKFTLLKCFGCVHPSVHFCVFIEKRPPSPTPPNTHTQRYTAHIPQPTRTSANCTINAAVTLIANQQLNLYQRRHKRAVTDDRPQHRSLAHFAWFSIVFPGKFHKSALSGPQFPTISVPNSSLTSPNLALQSNCELRTASVKVPGNKKKTVLFYSAFINSYLFCLNERKMGILNNTHERICLYLTVPQEAKKETYLFTYLLHGAQSFLRS